MTNNHIGDGMMIERLLCRCDNATILHTWGAIGCLYHEPTNNQQSQTPVDPKANWTHEQKLLFAVETLITEVQYLRDDIRRNHDYPRQVQEVGHERRR